MRYHAFNTGKPYSDAWWSRIRSLGIITTGFSGQPGDRGEALLRKMHEDDWILAYANGHGFVGAGQVGPESTY